MLPKSGGRPCRDIEKLQDELKATAEEAASFSAEQTKDMALADWGLKLKTAEQNVRNLRKELKNTGGLSFVTRFTPNALLKDYEVYAKDWANILRQSKTDLEQYEKKFGKLRRNILIFNRRRRKFRTSFYC